MLTKNTLVRIAVLSALLVLVSVSTVSAATGVDTSALRAAVTVEGIREHQAALQAIADANGGTRAAGTPGFDASVDYVVETLTAAGYSPTVQTFPFAFFQVLGPTVLERTSPDPHVYVESPDDPDVGDFALMTYSASGDVTANLQAVDLLLPPVGGSTSGCEGAFTEVGAGGFGNIVPDPSGPDDFASFTPGNIALIQRGTCTFALKATNAEAAGASGVIIFNEGNTPARSNVLFGTLGGPGPAIPVVGVSFAVGNELAGLLGSGPVETHLAASTASETREAANVIAETGGRGDRVVVVGAHLDSVLAGPGINDNGSGTATLLELAEQVKALGAEPRNRIRFAFWGAEEEGLLGSEYYVSQLTTRQIKDIAVNLNFDMLGSPNGVRFVYDGDGSGTGTVGPNGSDVIEDVFLDYFGDQSQNTYPTAFDGRSDYGPFIAVGIPAGGLFSGAEGTNPEVGGTLDPCYHQACDTFANNNNTLLDELADGAVHAVWTFAMTTSTVNGTDKGNGNAFGQAMEFLGSLLKK